jgi:hypothetical protein
MPEQSVNESSKIAAGAGEIGNESDEIGTTARFLVSETLAIVQKRTLS